MFTLSPTEGFARGVLCFCSAPFPYPGYNRAPFALSRLCLSFVFSRLRTLSEKTREYTPWVVIPGFFSVS